MDDEKDQPTPEHPIRQALANALPSVQVSPSLWALIEALELRRPDSLHASCVNLRRLFRSVPWLEAAMRERIPDASFSMSLLDRVISGTELRFDPDRSVELDARDVTIQKAAESSIPGIRCLGALCLLAFVDRGIPQRQVLLPSDTDIDDFAQSIRGLAKRGAGHPNRWTVQGLDASRSWSECATRYAEQLAQLGNPEWQTQWERWIAGSAVSAPISDPPTDPDPPDLPPADPPDAPDPNTRPTRKVTRVRPLDGGDAHTDRVSIPTRRPPAFPEADEDATVTASFVWLPDPVGTADEPSVDLATARRICFQAIRARNSSLLSGHIEALSQAEVSILVPALFKQVTEHLASKDVAGAAAGCLYLLMLASGRSLDRLAEIRLSTTTLPQPPTDLEIDLDGGVWRQPVFRPDNAVEADEKCREYAEPTQAWIDVPLPPPLVDALRQLMHLMPVAQPRGWFGRADICLLINDAVTEELHKVVGVVPISLHLARARRWLGPQLMDHGGDLAATMLICGDTFGRSTAPLYYYAPRVADLQALYRRAVWSSFGSEPNASDHDSHSPRVGSQAVATMHVVNDGLRSLHRYLQHAQVQATSGGWPEIVVFHNRLVAYVLLHFALVTTHRPENALALLRRNSVDTDARLALLRDKRSDAAHLLRAVVLSKQLCNQLDAYYAHLVTLSEDPDVPAQVRKHFRMAYASERGLFFFTDESGRCTPRTLLDDWPRYLPLEWGNLPKNWHRHFAATRLREAGAEPMLVMMQCGHLEACEYPFTPDSPLSVRQFRDRMAPVIDRYESSLNFQLRHTCRKAAMPEHGAPPFRSWAVDLREMQSRIRNVERGRLSKIIAHRRSARKAADTAARLALQALAAPAHLLLEYANSERAPGEEQKQAAERSLTIEVVKQLCDKVAKPNAGDVAPSLVRDALARLLRKLKVRYELEIPELGRAYSPPNPPPTPLLDGMLIANRQIAQLRDAFLHMHADRIRGSSPLLFRILSLVLLAGIDDRERLISALSCTRPEAMVALEGPLLLMNTGTTERDYFIGTCGLAALAIMSAPASALEDLDGASRTLHELLPEFFDDVPPDQALEILLETTAVAHRLEYSGLARFTDSADGSTAAAAAIQLPLMTGGIPFDMPSATDAVDIIHNTQSLVATAEDTRVQSPTPSKIRAARREYRDRVLQSLNPAAASTTRRRTRNQIVAILKSIFEHQSTVGRVSIEHALGRFALELAKYGTNTKQILEVSTIATYVTAIGGDLIEALAGIDLRVLDAEDFESLYVSIAEQKMASNTGTRAARQLLAFHECLVRRFNLTPIEVSELASYLHADDGRGVDANAVTDAEYLLARAWLEANAESAPDVQLADINSRRQCRIARLVLTMLYRSGARFREVVLLRHGDVLITDGEVTIFIRPNIYRGLKTWAARRRVVLGDVTSEERDELTRWMKGERLRLAGQWEQEALLFPDIESRRSSVDTAGVRQWITRGFAIGAGRHCWPHLLRHARAHQRIRDSAVSEPFAKDEARSVFRTQRRFRSASVVMGHASLVTTAASYLHTPWLLKAVESRRVVPGENRQAVAVVSGQTLSNIDKILQRRRECRHIGRFADPEQATLADLLLARRKVASPPEHRPLPITTYSLGQSQVPATVSIIDALLRNAETVADFLLLANTYGLRRKTTDRLLDGIENIARSYRYRFLEHVSQDLDGPKIPTPRLLSGHRIEEFLKRLDAADQDQRIALAILFRRCDSSRAALRDDSFRGSVADIAELRLLLRDLGIADLEVASVTKSTSSGGGRQLLRLQTAPGNLSSFDRIRWLLWVNVLVTMLLGDIPWNGTASEES